MLPPKEKAIELVKKYIELLKKTDTCLIDPCPNMIMCQHSWYMCEGWLSYAKQCALISVNEILDAINEWDHYWEQVKQEIINL
jgi:hypothetical protein